MRITEIIQTKSTSAVVESKTQDVVAQDIVSYNGDSAIMEGVSQILRRVKGKGLKPGFRCTSGPRKGRIVAKPSTCFMKLNPSKGAKIRKKRLAKAGIIARRTAQTKRSGAGSLRLKGAQIKQAKQKGPSFKAKAKGRSPIKSKIVRPK